MIQEKNNKIIEFAKTYNVYDNNNDNISYILCSKLIQKYLYYNLENKYVEFIKNFHEAHETKYKTVTPRLNFRKMKTSKNSNIIDISIEEERKFKINEILKDI